MHLYKLIKINILKLFIFTFISIYFVASFSPFLLPADINEIDSELSWPSGPSVNAGAAIVMEASTGLILYEKDIYSAYYPASITKIMTTLLALENCSLNETITMSHEAEWDVDFNSSRIGLVEGEQISLEDGLYAVMLESANEVSYCVGEHAAGGNITAFSEMMNKKVKELGGVNTNFTNPHGLHDPNHYTCAYDMALISQAAIAIPEFRKIAGTRTHQIPPTNKNTLRYLANHHQFIRKTLEYNEAIGGKTGGTEEAKTTLVTFAERNGLLLIAVVLYVDTALHAYEDTAAILDFSFDHYSSYNIVQTENLEEEIFPSIFDYGPYFKKESKELIQIGQNSNVILPNTADFNDAVKTIEFTPVEEFVHGENIIGRMSYTYAGRYVGAADIIYYNSSSPLTKAEFNNRWPKYLIYPDNFSTADNIPTADGSITHENDDINDSLNEITLALDKADNLLNKTSLIFSIIASLIVIFSGIIVISKKAKKKQNTIYK